MRALLKQHADVNAPQIDGMTALHWAAWQDDLETAKVLLKARADVSATNRYGVTPLATFAKWSKRLLTDSAADRIIRRRYGITREN